MGDLTDPEVPRSKPKDRPKDRPDSLVLPGLQRFVTPQTHHIDQRQKESPMPRTSQLTAITQPNVLPVRMDPQPSDPFAFC